MGRLIDIFLGTSDERKRKHNRREIQKDTLKKQRESNKKIRAFYQKKYQAEIKLRKTTKNRNKEKIEV